MFFSNRNFGDTVRKLRKARNFTQRDLAEYLNVTPTQVSDIENGKTSTAIYRAVELALFFNVSLDYLCGIENLNNGNLSQDDIALLQAFKSLPEHLQHNARGYIQGLHSSER